MVFVFISIFVWDRQTLVCEHEVRSAVDGLRESAANKAKRFDQEMSTMKDSSSCIKNDWINYTEKAESYYLEDTAAVESGKIDLDEVLQNCLQKTKMGSQQWNSAQDSLVSLEKSNVASVD